ncbi:MAG TPA: 30S ribosomal protein S16 [Candidatus Binatia bacterium]|nr:30S ribosomal protein S16 [Candidatus Binatia bacterium]
MLRIRLTRVGKKKQPYYRVVVADVEAKRDGRIVERIGHYNPLSGAGAYEIDEGRALYWLSVGAQPSDSVKQLLKRQGTLRRLRRLHEGESLDALVAEYQGTGVEAADAQAVAEARQAVAAPAAVATAVEEE